MSNQESFNISDASRILEVPPYTLRYWEKEFSDFLRPQQEKGKHRKYGEYEIELLKRIKKMLWDEKYSIAGARQKLKGFLLNEQQEYNQEFFLKIVHLLNQTHLLPSHQ
jgi:DNA-binding transcriptional MerR regulator